VSFWSKVSVYLVCANSSGRAWMGLEPTQDLCCLWLEVPRSLRLVSVIQRPVAVVMTVLHHRPEQVSYTPSVSEPPHTAIHLEHRMHRIVLQPMLTALPVSTPGNTRPINPRVSLHMHVTFALEFSTVLIILTRFFVRRLQIFGRKDYSWLLKMSILSHENEGFLATNFVFFWKKIFLQAKL